MILSMLGDKVQVKHGHPQMKAVVTTGIGGFERLSYRDVPIPVPGRGEVLLKVFAAGVNNTDINTRLGWYEPSVTGGTEQLSQDGSDRGLRPKTEPGGWNGKTVFPLIQGADCCGVVVAGGDDVNAPAIGKRVLVRACTRPNGFGSLDTVWLGSDFDGAFAQYVTVPASEVFIVDCDWSDAELATIPCAYGTAENMVQRARVSAGDRVLVTGASGGVGSAVVQLAKRRGAFVIAVVGRAKMNLAQALGADGIIAREADLVAELGANVIDVVFDNVAGGGFASCLKVLARGGRYVSSGAIAGPLVSLDMRDLYLKDLTLIGCTAWDEPVFPSLVGYIERGEIRPLVAEIFELKDIAKAQQEFMKKSHVGNFVLLPPQ